MKPLLNVSVPLLLVVFALASAPSIASADAVRFKTPGLVPPELDLPAHDSLLLVVEGWSSSSLEAAVLRAWRESDRGDTGGSTFGLTWTGPEERRIVTVPSNAGRKPLRIEVKATDPVAHDSWDSEKREKAQYGPVVISGTFYRAQRTVDLRVDVVVRGPDGEQVHATSESAQAKEEGDWAPSQEEAQTLVNGADTIAAGLIDGLALQFVPFLEKLIVKARPRSFALQKNKQCKKEIPGCLEALDILKRQDDLVGAYEAMAAIETEDPWIAYNAAVLAAALRRYDLAREHVAQAKERADEKRFDKLVRYIRDWEAEDQQLVDGGYPLEAPE